MIPAYDKLIVGLSSLGDEIPSRYGTTYELRGQQVRFHSTEMVTRKGINDAIGWMELLQILAGTFDRGEIERVAPRANHELFTAHMAYGPRLRWQIEPVLEKLEEDPGTRQAVLFVGKPEDGPTNEQPCTTSIQLLLRDEILDAYVSMRSWDAVKGLSYDVVCFGGLVQALAWSLGVVAGVVTVTAGSLHLYKADMIKPPITRDRSFRLDRLVVPDTWWGIRMWAEEQITRMEKIPEGIIVSGG